MKFTRLIAGILLFTSSLLAQNYLWPTSASKYLSASFCEYRPGHYHSAIDIKTWNQEGYPVFAIDDGCIYRIRVSPHGYGKVIYLKLKDGRFAVYAHLQRFAPKIEQAIRKEQLRRKRYSINWKPKNWPVKKGEILAYSGQTGIGVPHLHFEIRDPQNHALNPLHFFKDQIKDQIPPILQELLVIPLNQHSTVNGSILPRTFLLKKENGIYRPNEPIYAKGQIGLAIRGYDRANDVYNKYGFYQEILSVNQKLLFKASYDTLDFNKTSQIDVEIYYPLKALQKKRFHKLFREPFNQLNFYQTDQSNGILTVQHGKVPFTIQVRDFWNNVSTVEGVIQSDFDTSPRVLMARQIQNQLFIKMQLPTHLQELQLWASKRKGWQKIKYYEILQQQFKTNGQQMLVKATLNPGPANSIKITGNTTDQRHFNLIHDFSIPKDSLTVKLINLGKYWVVQYKPIEHLQDMTLQVFLNGKPVQPVTHLTPYFLEQVVKPESATLQKMRLVVRLFEKAVFDSTVQFAVIHPGKPQNLSFFNDSLKININSQALYDTLIFTVEKNESFLRLRDSIPLLSPHYQFSWYPQALRKPLNFTIKYLPNDLPPASIGCYALNGSGRFNFLGAKVDTLNHIVSFKSKGFKNFLALSDTVPPVVEILRPKAGQSYKNLKFVKISVDDSLSSLDSDLNFRIFIDDQWLIPEWDPERKLVMAIPHWPLDNGKHQLQVEVKDQAGNISRKSLEFFIKGYKK